jgi:hypothetical protein
MTTKTEPWLADRKPCADRHTPTPSGYVAFFEWAEQMAKTHRCTKCPDCHLWAIWVPKETQP